MARATAGMLVSSESKVTVTMAALVSTCVPVTPGTFSSAFSIVMLHAGQVMFAASSTTFSGVFPVAAPANIMSIRPKVHLRMDHLLEKPAHVIRKQQSNRDHERGQPQPTPTAVQSPRIDARTLSATM